VSTWLTLIALALLTGLAVRGHLRRNSTPGGDASATSSFHSCPRCSYPVPPEAATCPECRVPMQSFELVQAETVREEAGTGAEAEREHAVVRWDLCVGCGTCVDACNVPGAIWLSDKRALVAMDHCIGAGDCVKACPTGAIFLSTGDAVQRVEVPEVDVCFQTSIPGLYIVGELGGRGLIKNAINEGRIAVEHVAASLGLPGARSDGDASALDLVIVGTGPAGLSAALQASRSGISYVVLERGTVADTIRKYPRHKLMLAEPSRVPLYGDLWIADSSKETLIRVWESIIESESLNVLTEHEVTAIQAGDSLFEVEVGETIFRARRVVLAMGRRGKPRRLGVPGEELAKTVYDISEMEPFAGRRVLVVGGGDSAVESAVGLSVQPGTAVTMSYRGAGFKRVKERNIEKLNAAVSAGRVRLLLESEVEEIGTGSVRIRHSGGSEEIPNDDVIVRIGGDPPYAFLEKIGVEIVKKDVAIETPAGAGA